MNELKLETIVLGIVQTNTYIISNPQLKEAIVVDPADDAKKIEQYLKANDLVCKAILLTHGHFDHILAALDLKEDTSAPIYAHEAEAMLLGHAKLNASEHIRRECSLVPDILLKDAEILSQAGFMIKVIHTPGHTAGGVCYYFTGHGVLISGDTLFYEDIGRSDLPTGNHKQLVEGIRNKLMCLEDSVRVYPGHGCSTTIGHERDHNIYISASSQLFDE